MKAARLQSFNLSVTKHGLVMFGPHGVFLNPPEQYNWLGSLGLLRIILTHIELDWKIEISTSDV